MNKKLLGIVIFILILFVLYINTIGNDLFLLKINWGIKLPKPTETIYSKQTDSSFNGDGIYYLIVKYNSSKKIKEIPGINWNMGKNVPIENEITKELNAYLKIDKDHFLNFDNKYWYYEQKREDSSKLFLIYMPNREELYIIQFIQ